MRKFDRLPVRRFFTGLCVAGGVLAVATSAAAAAPVQADPVKARQVEAGRLKQANAAWWGFDPNDATAQLQAAVDSGAETLIVPNMGRPWFVETIRLASNQEILFEEGVIIEAKEGAFQSPKGVLMRGDSVDNVTLRGDGATLRMRRYDYVNPELYEPGEWRHALAFRSSRNITIEGLRIENSGGDGIYIGVSGQGFSDNSPVKPYCENVVIRNVVCDRNHRQGLSVISVSGMLVEDSVFKNTGGTGPAAGIDFEPNHPASRMENIVVRNCEFDNNAGAGALIYLRHLSRESHPISIRFEACRMTNSGTYGIAIGALQYDGPEGTIDFADCSVVRSSRAGLYVYDKAAERVTIRLANTIWREVAMGYTAASPRRPTPQHPVVIRVRRANFLTGTRYYGGVVFENCRIEDTWDRATVFASASDDDLQASLQGTIRVDNPFGARMDLARETAQVDLQLTHEFR